MDTNISFKTEKYIRLELTQQSLHTSHVSAPSVVSTEESKWTYAGGSNSYSEACNCFCSVTVITCPLRAQDPQFDPGQKHAFGVLFTENEKSNIPLRTEIVLHQATEAVIYQLVDWEKGNQVL